MTIWKLASIDACTYGRGLIFLLSTHKLLWFHPRVTVGQARDCPAQVASGLWQARVHGLHGMEGLDHSNNYHNLSGTWVWMGSYLLDRQHQQQSKEPCHNTSSFLASLLIEHHGYIYMEIFTQPIQACIYIYVHRLCKGSNTSLPAAWADIYTHGNSLIMVAR
jgi:hypothetical protein